MLIHRFELLGVWVERHVELLADEDVFELLVLILRGEVADIRKNRWAKLLRDGNPLDPKPLRMHMLDAPSRHRFEKIVNRALIDLFASGEIRRIYARWFNTKDLTVPLNQYLKEAFAVPNTYPAWP